VPALLWQNEEPAFGEPGEMAARGLRRDAAGKGELGGVRARPSSNAVSMLARAGLPTSAATSASDG
jgi:hypothetical protein